MWTYSGDPSATSRDAVRFLVGDTDTADQQSSDEEIAYAIAQSATTRGAAAILAEALVAKYARLTSKSVGDLSINYAQRQEHYAVLAKRLRTDESIRGAIPYCGGISVSDKETVEDDTDRIKPAFRRGMHDHGSGQDGSGSGDTANAT